jgi:uncharacterized protein (TIGR03437 family)
MRGLPPQHFWLALIAISALSSQPLRAEPRMGLPGRVLRTPSPVFEPNAGQAASDERFVARSGGGSMTVLSSCGAAFNEGAIRMSLEHANRSPIIFGTDEQPGRVHYYEGSDPKRWRTNIPTYRAVKCRSVYAGTDLIYHANQQRLEYDFLLAPGADPRAIRLRFDGVSRLRLASNGDLIVGDRLRFRKPAIFQESNGRRTEVSGTYRLYGGQHAGFHLAAYDASRPLVIDPVVVFLQVGYGGEGLAVDGTGNVFVAGSGALSKLDPAGILIYSTYLYPSASGNMYATTIAGIAVDAGGNAYVTGATNSLDFPTTANAFQRTSPESPGPGKGDAFVMKLNPAGSIVYSTYLAGKSNDGGFGIAVDNAGNALVTGWTESHDFPTANALQADNRDPLGCTNCAQAFVTKLDPTGSGLVYSTYLGGGKGYDFGRGVAVDGAGNAAVTGQTGSADFPTLNAAQSAFGSGACSAVPPSCSDAFAAKLSPSGHLIYSTYLGGSNGDVGFAIAADAVGNVYVAGFTESPDFPTAKAFQSAMAACVPNGGWVCGDAFVTKLSASGQIIYSTYLGGSSNDGATGIAVDRDGAAFVSGLTASFDFPTLNPIQANYISFEDAFVAKLSPAGSTLLFSTYFASCLPDVGCKATYAQKPVIAQAGVLYVAETIWDATTTWGYPETAGVLAKIDLNGAPMLDAHGIVNAASFRSGPVAPGEIVTLFGDGLGPFVSSQLQLDSAGLAATLLNGTRVLFDGVAAPMVYTSPNQVSAVVPYEVAGRSSTEVRVEFTGTKSDAVTMPVAAASPGIFSAFYPASGEAIATNEDGRINSPNNPARRGSIISLCATGEGLTNPPGVDGKRAGDQSPRPVLPVAVRIGGIAAEVLYAGGAPGQVAGVMQLNVRIPADVAPGNTSVELSVDRFTSQSGVTIAVR